MYKLLLCWRYLRTRYIALVCIVSVTLGVATMIVVNSVMAGFTREMQSRLNGMLGDLVFETRSMDGALDADFHMQQIRKVAGDDVAGMSPTVHLPALMYVELSNGERIPRQITLVGIDERNYAQVSQFGEYLQHPANRRQLSFQLRDDGYDSVDHLADDPTKAPKRIGMEDAGWRYRRYRAMLKQQRESQRRRAAELEAAATRTATATPTAPSESTPAKVDPFAAAAAAADSSAGANGEGEQFDAAREQHVGLVAGIGLCGFRAADGSDQFLALPGDDVNLVFPNASLPPKIVSTRHTIVDFYESKMNEYDANFVFVPLRQLQQDRGLIDPETGIARFTSIQIRLRPGADADAIRDRIRDAFPEQLYAVSTWRDKQGPLLAAVQMEIVLLNVLLFLIVAVAGFGILAIFYMIVVEKTRDIGILKSLGASGRGVMGIFLGYGVSLGVVGSGVGLALGLMFVGHINEIADLLGRLTGQPVFDPSVYYFYKIPTATEPFTVAWIVSGAVGIAVLASILPARRAARLHPVRALRFE